MSANQLENGRRASLPLAGRLQLLADRRLGVGNFLDRVRTVSSAPDEPFLFAQRAPHGDVALERLSLRRLTEIRDECAAWYHAAGVRKGEPVGVCVSDDVEPFLQFLALSSLGAIAALVNGRMDPSVAGDYLRRIGAVGVVATRERLRALDGSGTLPDDLRFAAEVRTLRQPGRGARLPDVFPYRHGDNDVVMLCHTSGTTGPPKAASFAHRQFFLGKRHRLLTFPAARENRMLSAMPQSHSAGISYLMTATLLGLPTLVMAQMSGAAVHLAMGQIRPTIVAGFPQTYAELAQLDLDPHAVSEVHTWINTGDSAHEAHIRALVRHGRRGRRPGSAFVDGLGSSEMGMALFRRVSTVESTLYGRCVGKPVRTVQRAAVLDDHGRELGPGRAGRLGVRTPTVTPGYWNDSALTAKSFLSGYWLTGDVVYHDRAGRFFHLDREPDVIHAEGGPVYSLPMEEAILACCPSVADCAVVAVAAPGLRHASMPFASVRLKPAVRAPADLLSTLNQVLGMRGQPRLAGAVVASTPADFPTGPTGKVLKRKLRERFVDVLDRAVTHDDADPNPDIRTAGRVG